MRVLYQLNQIDNDVSDFSKTCARFWPQLCSKDSRMVRDEPDESDDLVAVFYPPVVVSSRGQAVNEAAMFKYSWE